MDLQDVKIPHEHDEKSGAEIARADGAESGGEFHKELFGAIEKNLHEASKTNPETAEKLERMRAAAIPNDEGNAPPVPDTAKPKLSLNDKRKMLENGTL